MILRIINIETGEIYELDKAYKIVKKKDFENQFSIYSSHGSEKPIITGYINTAKLDQEVGMVDPKKKIYLELRMKEVGGTGL